MNRVISHSNANKSKNSNRQTMHCFFFGFSFLIIQTVCWCSKPRLDRGTGLLLPACTGKTQSTSMSPAPIDMDEMSESLASLRSLSGVLAAQRGCAHEKRIGDDRRFISVSSHVLATSLASVKSSGNR